MSLGFLALRNSLVAKASNTPETSIAVTKVNMLKRKIITSKLTERYASDTLMAPEKTIATAPVSITDQIGIPPPLIFLKAIAPYVAIKIPNAKRNRILSTPNSPHTSIHNFIQNPFSASSNPKTPNSPGKAFSDRLWYYELTEEEWMAQVYGLLHSSVNLRTRGFSNHLHLSR